MSAELDLFTDPSDFDPLRPGLEWPTPAELVGRLTRPDRERRVRLLIDQAHMIHEMAIAALQGGRELVAEMVLFSGGNDSTTLAHMFRGRADYAVHANTGIGVEETRQFVRDTCAGWGLPLLEKKAPDSYEDLVLGKVLTKAGEPVWAPGFPGPAAHAFAYARLKERALDLIRHELGFAGSQSKCAVFIAGRRRAESKRREDVPLYESDGTVIWSSPIAMWTKLDLNTYRLMHPDVPHNPVTDKLHMSAECLCGAYAKPGELEEIRFWYPEVAAKIDALQEAAKAAGIPEPYCRWGHGQGKPSGSGRMCQSCDDRFQGVLFDA